MVTARSIAAFAICSIAVCGTAKAQLVGNYGGQRADGTPVSISVSRFRGHTFVSFVQVQANTTCRDGTTFDTNTFVAGIIAPVTGSNIALSYSTDNTYIGGSLVFDNATRSVSGFLSDKLAKLAASPAAPTNVTFCAQPRQAFAAVLSAKAAFDPKLMTIGNGVPQ